MRKTLLSTLVAAGLSVTGGAQAALVFDFNGAQAGGEHSITSFDWGPSTYLALGGNAAVADWLNDFTSWDPIYNPTSTNYKTFDGYMQAKLNSPYVPVGYEITMVTKFTEVITGVDVTVNRFGVVTGSVASFRTTGVGWLEMYYGPENSSNLHGSGFNDGILILSATGVSAPNGSPSVGSFTSSSVIELLDAGATNLYGSQQTIVGNSAQGDLKIGSGGRALDSDFFKTTIPGFSMEFSNLAMTLPISSNDPADCFITTQGKDQFNNTLTVGNTNYAASCSSTAHVNGPYSAQTPLDPAGNTPNVGTINGRIRQINGVYVADGPDFLASADINSLVTGVFIPTPTGGAVPEPATLALLGLGLAGLGFSVSRRRA